MGKTKFTVGCFAVIRKGNQVLMVEHNGDQMWSLPGGGLHGGENVLEGLSREVLEETGQSIKPGSLTLVAVFTISTKDRPEQEPDLVFLYSAQVENGACLIPDCSGEIGSCQYLDLEQVLDSPIVFGGQKVLVRVACDTSQYPESDRPHHYHLMRD